MGTIGLIVYLFFLFAIYFAGMRILQRINNRYRRARALPVEAQPRIEAPIDTGSKRALLRRPLALIRYYSKQRPVETVAMLANDRALAIGLIAALITVSVHNFVDDVYVHSLTSLIALLLIALIRLERVMPNV
jgi:hypothetical protein